MARLIRAALLLWVAALWFPAGTRAEPAPLLPGEPANIGEFFNGERYGVEITVLGGMFTAGKVQIGFDRIGEREYLAWMETEGQGITRVFSKFVSNRYESYMRLSLDGRRLITYKFNRRVIKTDKVMRSFHTFDYEKRYWTARVLQNEEVIEERDEAIPEGVIYENYLSAVYNFRAGVFGPLEPGTEWRIQGIPKADAQEYPVRLLPHEEAQPIIEEIEEGDPFWVTSVLVPKEAFGVDTDEVRFVMSARRVPLEARARNVIGFTDVVGRTIMVESKPAPWPAPSVLEPDRHPAPK